MVKLIFLAERLIFFLISLLFSFYQCETRVKIVFKKSHLGNNVSKSDHNYSCIVFHKNIKNLPTFFTTYFWTTLFTWTFFLMSELNFSFVPIPIPSDTLNRNWDNSSYETYCSTNKLNSFEFLFMFLMFYSSGNRGLLLQNGNGNSVIKIIRYQ